MHNIRVANLSIFFRDFTDDCSSGDSLCAKGAEEKSAYI